MTKITNIILAFLILCCASTAAAGEGSLFEPISVRVTGKYLSDADYKDSDGSSSIAGGQMRVNAGGFSFSYEGQHYSWDNVGQLNFGNGQDDPWNTLHRFSLGYSLNGAINENWFYGAGITGTSAFEEQMEDSFGGALRGHIGYFFNDNLKALIGLRAFANSIRVSAMPYFGVNYTDYAADGSGYFVNLGMPATEVGYSFDKVSTLRAAFNFDGKTYRLKDDSSVSDAGYIETSSMKFGVYYDYKPIKNCSISIGPEYVFARETKFFDKNGDKFGSEDQEAAFGAFFNLRYKF
ncbi:DUF6268 family outer membrane beta-barrel protein [Maridesulfovibrio salexigens]|uniref:DUF6268 domain-containing protein n=1 Tax=Maridesulfovibrio salexigens (strain ATCC 14822 / DSM 2638 / NCIMB 8403 / VKM B-1763) TaxID=526222 RepID=C6BSK3_MARSD|nr:DUF6268 family outer membrane beta-barrel protein [Maridesulfovibrio salexigens]ACS81459.1 conserved hypothetical protein [Maridesulfovibrio salexigens DSM 2638]